MRTLRQLRQEISEAQCQRKETMHAVIEKCLKEIRTVYGDVAEYETVNDLGLKFLGFTQEKRS